MQTESALRAWEKRLDYLRQAAHDWYSNWPGTIEDYSGDKIALANDLIWRFSANYVLTREELRFVTERFREMVEIEEDEG